MDSSQVSDKLWDYIFVGGGLSASVVSHRLYEHDSNLKILIVEAGPNVNDRADIVWPNSTNLIGGEFDWKYNTTSQANLNGRSISLPCGKALGGGTAINSNGWVRGDKFDYDLWGEKVHDKRWTYEGLLPFMRKSEHFWSDSINRMQHGHNGPAFIQSVTSTNRPFPLRDYALQAWGEIGIDALPHLDGNVGNPLGVGELQENKMSGRREIASSIYSLDGITVLTETAVEKLLIEETAPGQLVAVGIKLQNGTGICGRETIVSAGAVRSPQLLMLSGIGPSEELTKFNIPVLLNHPHIGKNLMDHTLFHHAWKVKDPTAGWALGSPNHLFREPQYGWGTPSDFVVSSDIPKDGLISAIAEDEGITPGPTHPLLLKRTFVEHVFMYAGAPDGSLVTLAAIVMLPTSHGAIKLTSANASDPPLIDPNYVSTAVDRYVLREAVKLQIKYADSNETIIGREILNGEAGIPGFDEPFSIHSTDEYIDARVRAGVGSCFHPMGSVAMGTVLDTNLKVRGVNNLRVVDTSVFPIPITGHLQVATFAMAEQAAEIIFSDRERGT